MAGANLTKLEGVNRILRAASEHPVPDLESATENDSLMAEDILDEILKREQMTGLHLNSTEAAFTPDGTTGFVELPVNTLQVKGWNQQAARHYFHKEVDGAVFLFDSEGLPSAPGSTRDFGTNGTDDAEVFVIITTCEEFVDLPIQHQYSIVDQAAVEYQQSVLGSNSRDSQLLQRAARSRAIARAYDMRSRPNNQFEDGRSQGPRMGRFMPRSWPWNDLRHQ